MGKGGLGRTGKGGGRGSYNSSSEGIKKTGRNKQLQLVQYSHSMPVRERHIEGPDTDATVKAFKQCFIK